MMIENPALESLTRVLGATQEYKQVLTQFQEKLQAEQQQMQVGAAALWHMADSWDSENFGVSVGKITSVAGHNRADITAVVAKYMETKPYTYTVLRLDQKYTQWLQAFQERSAYLLDGSIDLFWQAHAMPTKKQDAKILVVPFADKHKAAVLECAAAFRYGRFFSDPHFQVGKKIYKQWVENALAGTAADLVFVAEAADAVVGFIGVSEKKLGSKQYLYIPLIAKHPQATTKHVGQALLLAVQEYAAAHGFAGISLGTQTNNIGALRSYTQAGFVPYASEFTFGLYTPARL